MHTLELVSQPIRMLDFIHLYYNCVYMSRVFMCVLSSMCVCIKLCERVVFLPFQQKAGLALSVVPL